MSAVDSALQNIEQRIGALLVKAYDEGRRGEEKNAYHKAMEIVQDEMRIVREKEKKMAIRTEWAATVGRLYVGQNGTTPMRPEPPPGEGWHLVSSVKTDNFGTHIEGGKSGPYIAWYWERTIIDALEQLKSERKAIPPPPGHEALTGVVPPHHFDVKQAPFEAIGIEAYKFKSIVFGLFRKDATVIYEALRDAEAEARQLRPGVGADLAPTLGELAADLAALFMKKYNNDHVPNQTWPIGPVTTEARSFRRYWGLTMDEAFAVRNALLRVRNRTEKRRLRSTLERFGDDMTIAIVETEKQSKTETKR